MAPETLSALAKAGMEEIAHYLRPGHLAQLKAILDDPEASKTTGLWPWSC